VRSKELNKDSGIFWEIKLDELKEKKYGAYIVNQRNTASDKYYIEKAEYKVNNNPQFQLPVTDKVTYFEKQENFDQELHIYIKQFKAEPGIPEVIVNTKDQRPVRTKVSDKRGSPEKHIESTDTKSNQFTFYFTCKGDRSRLHYDFKMYFTKTPGYFIDDKLWGTNQFPKLNNKNIPNKILKTDQNVSYHFTPPHNATPGVYKLVCTAKYRNEDGSFTDLDYDYYDILIKNLDFTIKKLKDTGFKRSKNILYVPFRIENDKTDHKMLFLIKPTIYNISKPDKPLCRLEYSNKNKDEDFWRYSLSKDNLFKDEYGKLLWIPFGQNQMKIPLVAVRLEGRSKKDININLRVPSPNYSKKVLLRVVVGYVTENNYPTFTVGGKHKSKVLDYIIDLNDLTDGVSDDLKRDQEHMDKTIDKLSQSITERRSDIGMIKKLYMTLEQTKNIEGIFRLIRYEKAILKRLEEIRDNLIKKMEKFQEELAEHKSTVDGYIKAANSYGNITNPVVNTINYQYSLIDNKYKVVFVTIDSIIDGIDQVIEILKKEDKKSSHDESEMQKEFDLSMKILYKVRVSFANLYTAINSLKQQERISFPIINDNFSMINPDEIQRLKGSKRRKNNMQPDTRRRDWNRGRSRYRKPNITEESRQQRNLQNQFDEGIREQQVNDQTNQIWEQRNKPDLRKTKQMDDMWRQRYKDKKQPLPRKAA
jgi:hypothetical protein